MLLDYHLGEEKGEVTINQTNLFTTSPSVQSSRILYTPSPFARSSLLHLQEVGSLTAIKPHTSKREKLQSYLCFMVEDGEGELVYEGKKYELRSGDVVFIDCRKSYSHSTGNSCSTGNAHSVDNAPGIDSLCDSHSDGIALKLWSLRWCPFYGPSMPAIYAKYCERGGLPVIRRADMACGADVSQYTSILTDIYALASSSDYIRDMRINGKLSDLLTLLMESSWHRERYSNAPKNGSRLP